MKIYKYTNKIISAVLIPFTFSAAFMLVSELLRVISVKFKSATVAANGFEMYLGIFVGFVISFAIPYKLCKNMNVYKGFVSALSFAVFSSGVFALSQVKVGLVFSVIIGCLITLLFNKINMKTASLIGVAGALLFGTALGYIDAYYQELLKSVLTFAQNKGFATSLIFGILKNILDVFSTAFSDMAYYTGFSQSVFIDNAIVSGAKNIFDQNANSKTVLIYLTGNFPFLFALCGMSFALFDEISVRQKQAFAALAVCSVLSGRYSLLLVLIFLESPFLFVYAILIGGVSYVSAYLIGNATGFMFGGGLVEMLSTYTGGFLLFGAGVALAALSYFAFKYGILKYSVAENENIYIPKELKHIVDALGGIHNIIKIKDNSVEVRNVKLIDTLKIDGEIKENVIVSSDDSFDALSEYIE